MLLLFYLNLCPGTPLTWQVSITGTMKLADNSTVNLIEPNWTPLILTGASGIHFFLSALLIVSYCYLKVKKKRAFLIFIL